MIFPASAVFFGREKPACRKGIFADKNSERKTYCHLIDKSRSADSIILRKSRRIRINSTKTGLFIIHELYSVVKEHS